MQKGRIWARPEGGFRLTRRFYLDERKGLKSAEETGLGSWEGRWHCRGAPSGSKSVFFVFAGHPLSALATKDEGCKSEI